MSPHHSDAKPLPHSISGDKGLGTTDDVVEAAERTPQLPPDRTDILSSHHVCLPSRMEKAVPNIRSPFSQTICSEPGLSFHPRLSQTSATLFRQGSPCRSMVFPRGQALGKGKRSRPRSPYVPSPSGRWHLLCLLLLLPLSVELRLTRRIQRQ